MTPLTVINIREQISEILRENPGQIQPSSNKAQLPFIQKISTSAMTIEDPEVRGGDKLKRVDILGLPCEDVDDIWRVNLEANVNYVAAGEKIKTVETALIVSRTNDIRIYLIELKTSLVGEHDGESDSKLSGLKKKFEDSMSRMCVILALRERHHPHFAQMNIKFTGIVFYNADYLTSQQSLANDHDLIRLYEALKEGHGKVFVYSLIRREKIQVIFFKNPQARQPQRIETHFNLLQGI